MAEERGVHDIELSKLIELMDEILDKPLIYPDDALELAIVAGLAHRLGAPDDVMRQAVVWREEIGRDLIDEMWEQVDLDPLLETLDDAISASSLEEPPRTRAASEEEEEEEEGDPLENALFDIDDIIAAAIWCGRPKLVKAAARAIADSVRQVPDAFVPLSPFAVQLARLPTVAEHIDLYDYWLAIADAPRLVEG